MHGSKTALLRQGWVVFGGLAILTVAEYWVATTLGSNVIPLLAIIALVKAALVIQYFMHVAQLWGTEGE